MRFAAIDRAVGAQGRKIVFLLRLSPIFPFNLLYYALGLTRVRLADYLVASLGMIPGTLLYVYSGKLAGDVAAVAGGAGVERGAGYYALLGLGFLATVVVTHDSDYAQLAQLGAGLGAQLITQKYGRDAEREADYYGMKYMSLSGYDTQGAVDLQKTFVKLSEGRRQDFLSGLFASHPPSQERVQNNIRTLSQYPPAGNDGRKTYKTKIARLEKTQIAQFFDIRATLSVPAHGCVKILYQRINIHGLPFCRTVFQRDVLESLG